MKTDDINWKGKELWENMGIIVWKRKDTRDLKLIKLKTEIIKLIVQWNICIFWRNKDKFYITPLSLSQFLTFEYSWPPSFATSVTEIQKATGRQAEFTEKAEKNRIYLCCEYF